MQANALRSALSLHVVPVADLAFVDRGWSRGHATGTLFPMNAPGYLEMGPVMVAVIDEIDPGFGFDMHAHRAIETILMPLSGSITHEDSLGERSITGPEDIAVLRAGSGIEHAERCSGDVPMRAVMFMLTGDATATPSFTRQTMARADRVDRLRVLASGRGAPGATPVSADVELSAAMLSTGSTVTHEVMGSCYVMAPDGAVQVNGVPCGPGDRVVVAGEGVLEIRALASTEVVVFDCYPSDRR